MIITHQTNPHGGKPIMNVYMLEKHAEQKRNEVKKRNW